MEASSSAPEAHQVSRMVCHFVGPTSGTVARAHGSLNSRCHRLAAVCRLRNYFNDLLRELPMSMTGLHEHALFRPAALGLEFPSYLQAVRSTNPTSDPCCDVLPGAHHVHCLWIPHVCAVGGSCSKSFVDTTIFASGRTPSTYQSFLYTRAAQVRRYGFAASAPTQLTAPYAHESVLLCQ